MNLHGTVKLWDGEHPKIATFRWNSTDPVGTATVQRSGGTDSLTTGYSGDRLPGILRSVGARGPAGRVGVLLPASESRTGFEEGLDNIIRSGAGDPAWVRLEEPAQTTDAAIEGLIYLLAERQLTYLGGYSASLTRCRLPSGALIEVAVVEGREGERQIPELFGAQPFEPPGVRFGQLVDDSLILGAVPSSTYRDALPSSHAYFAVLHPSHRDAFRRASYALLQNKALERAYPGLDSRVPIRVCYSDRIRKGHAAVEETALIAAGLREGEACWIRPTGRRRPLSGRAFAYRHVVCRVGPATTLDQDKPVCRIPEAVFDVLGLKPGSPVLVEGAGPPGSQLKRLPQWTLRALPEREPVAAVPLRGGAPDFFGETGSVDLPMIRIDGTRQKELGVSRGSTLYIRPALTTFLTQETSGVGWLLSGGIVASLAQDRLELAASLAAVLLLAAIVVAARRMRQ